MESRKAQKIPLLRNTLISSMHASKLIYEWKRSTSLEKKKNDENNEWWMLQERNCHGIYNGQKSGSFATEY
jgi:hypothetical protein